MKQEIFKELYDKFDGQFQIGNYQKNLTYWKKYVDELGDIEEFPIDKWIKQDENDKTYLPSYLEHQEFLQYYIGFHLYKSMLTHIYSLWFLALTLILRFF